MESFKLDDSLWKKALGKPFFFLQSGGLTSLAFSFTSRQRLPAEGFSVHSGPEVFVVVAGEIQLGLEVGERTIGPGTVTVLEAGEKHYTRNSGDEEARVVSFGLPS